MNLAEIQKAASDAYSAAHLDGYGSSANERHAAGIAAVVAAVAQAVLAGVTQEEVEAIADKWPVSGVRRDVINTAASAIISNRLASLLKPADERAAVLSRWISEADMPEALAALDALPKGRA